MLKPLLYARYARFSPLNLLRELLPPSCLLCGSAATDALCLPCIADLPRTTSRCQRCALPLQQDQAFCGECLRRLPAFDHCEAAFPYEAPVSQLVSQFKHRGNLPYGAALARLMADQLKDRERPDFITPVPLHWRRQLLRGFNQAHYLALTLGARLGLPVKTVAKRLRPTGQQQQLSRRQRLRNLKGAFAVDETQVAGKHIALVDDVLTTGATAEALARGLKAAGAKRVDVWVLARTPAPGD